MLVFNFTIPGNNTNPDGNALPKLRKTYNQRWTPEAQNYSRWKLYVEQCFFNANNKQKIKIGDCDHRKDQFGGRWNKPIDVNCRARMDLKIYWANGAHGDPENIFGSIADALFVNDKNLDGSFEAYRAEDGKGRVEVKITIFCEDV